MAKLWTQSGTPETVSEIQSLWVLADGVPSKVQRLWILDSNNIPTILLANDFIVSIEEDKTVAFENETVTFNCTGIPDGNYVYDVQTVSGTIVEPAPVVDISGSTGTIYSINNKPLTVTTNQFNASVSIQSGTGTLSSATVPNNGSVTFTPTHPVASDYTAVISATSINTDGASTSDTISFGVKAVVSPTTAGVNYASISGGRVLTENNTADFTGVAGSAYDTDGGESNVNTVAEVVSAGVVAYTLTNQNVIGNVSIYSGVQSTSGASTDDSFAAIRVYRNGSVTAETYGGWSPGSGGGGTIGLNATLAIGDVIYMYVASAAGGSANHYNGNLAYFTGGSVIGR